MRHLHHGCTFAKHMHLVDQWLLEEQEIPLSWLEDFKFPEVEEEEILEPDYEELNFD